MSREEWRRVVEALWLMRTLSEEEGQARFGPTYRSIAYFEIRRAPPRAQVVHKTMHAALASATLAGSPLQLASTGRLHTVLRA
tara:strand:+ start:175 stop:423 length:249 start_codon:yes stop_codon:yes gene_type:complete